MKYTLNLTRLLCPLPVIRLGEKINTVAVGDTIELHCTDRGVLHDIPAWCSVHGHQIIDTQEKDTKIIIQVVKNKVE